ncbi:hypothetical protein BpHYR1_005773 [Brachionus plicatilis]|uniref:Uncharacterized protein n=1 Tax=Brachionus plicatilis TaxID=10195 RepID=A0A3M7QB11_BRAPC|nr:hypothetical protein BpHYR1_005773 [Brachionus plicatilis]
MLDDNSQSSIQSNSFNFIMFEEIIENVEIDIYTDYERSNILNARKTLEKMLTDLGKSQEGFVLKLDRDNGFSESDDLLTPYLLLYYIVILIKLTDSSINKQENLTKTPVALSFTYSTTFQEPAIPLPQNNNIQAANNPIFSQLIDPQTPVRPPGLDSFESEQSSNYESNNEMSSNIQTTKPLKQRKKRTSSTIAKSKAKTLRTNSYSSTSSIDENAFFDSNEDILPTKQLY